MEKQEWFVPAYYPDFQCKADKCRHTCCSRWRIPVSKEEYNRLVTLDCSKELDRRILNAFVTPDIVTDDCYRYIAFNWLGECPILDSGLCSLHREMGEKVLPKVCRLYPRSLKKAGPFNVASCSSSCERVVEILFESDALNIVKVISDQRPEIIYPISEEDGKRIVAFQEIIKDRSISLAESIARICRIINAEEFDRDLSCGKDPLAEAILVLERLPFSNDILLEAFQLMQQRYGEDRDLFDRDRVSFEVAYPDWMSFFERVINNSMIYECFPFLDKRLDLTDSYKGLCVSYGLLRALCIAWHTGHQKKEDLIDVVAALFHLIDHTPFYYNTARIAGHPALMLKI